MKSLLWINRGALTKVVAINLVLLVLVGSNCLAQSIATRVSGTVKDSSGAVVAGVKITLIDVATGRETTATTNQEGFFAFPDVRAGNYTIIAEQEGFKKAEVRDIQANVDIPATVNIQLEVGQVIDIVTTTATESQAVVNTENAALQTTVLEKQINDLPLNGRNPLDLAQLQAGVATNSTNDTATINGLRGTFSNITWDGINLNDNFFRVNGLFAQSGQRVVSVAEFTLTTQNGGADDGLGVAQVKLVTPRGGKEYHGQLFEFHRNDALAASRFFNNANNLPKEKLIRNQFGFALGGPIKLPQKVFGPLGFDTEKLFFYSYYEGTRIARESAKLRTVLTQSARLGNFTYRKDDGTLGTVNLLDKSGRTIDPAMQSLINLTPLPNDFTQGDRNNFTGYRFNSRNSSSDNLFGFRVDYDHSPRHRFEATYNRLSDSVPNDADNNVGEQFPGLPGLGQASVTWRGAFAWNWTPTQSLNNEVRWGFNAYDVKFPTNETFPGGYQLTLPLITNPVQNTLPQGRNVGTYDFMDNATWAKGNHSVRFGGNFRRVLVETFDDAGRFPNYTIGFNNINNRNPLNTGLFPGGISPNDFANASNILATLIGTVSSVAQTFNVTSRESGFVPGAGNVRNINYYAGGVYVNDNWRLKPNFSINLGLRWEYISPPTETNGLALLPRGGLEALRDPNAILDFAGSGTGRKFYNEDLNNFAPSISIAWDPFKNGKTSIRAGYSISYVIDNNVTTVENSALRTNDGLVAGAQRLNLSGTVSTGGLIPLPIPTFKVPRPIKDNFAITPTPILFTIDPDLQTPYVQQWTFGISREILPDTALEVRYVGNRGVKLTRGIDINQVTIFSNGFFEDFLRAQRNLIANNNPEVGEPLLIFPKLGLRGALGDAGLRNLIRQGQVGELASIYTQFREDFLTPGLNGATLSPGFFLPANPNAFVADYIGNFSFSTYHALQAEVRRRLRHGLYLQANYTYSKALTDFDGSSTNFSGLLDLNTGTPVEKRRSAQDVTHIFKANAVYELPFGRGKRFLDSGGVLDRIVGGWEISPILQLRSGRPINIVSARGTVNRGGRSGTNTVNTTLSISELQDLTGYFKSANGVPLLFDPKLIGPDGRANLAFFQNPLAGQLGTLQLTPVSGPKYFNVDTAIIKRIAITEQWKVQLRGELFNTFNNVNFDVDQNQNINSTSFGVIGRTFDPRILQFALRVEF